MDAALRTSDPDIYAAGDVAAVEHPLLGDAAARRALGERPQRRPGGRARDARPGGLATTGCRTSSPTSTTWAWSTPATHRPAPTTRWCAGATWRKREFVAFWLRESHVLAGMNVNVWDVTEPPGPDPLREPASTADALADPAVPLASLLG